MRTSRIIAAAALLLTVVASVAFAGQRQCWKGSGGWGSGGSYGRLYDVKTVETVAGEVVSIDRITPRKGMNYGIHLMLKTDNETIPVHLGPSWFIEHLDKPIAAGSQVEVTGSRITFDGKPAIIASQVRLGEDILKLRDENGIPVWAGWRRR